MSSLKEFESKLETTKCRRTNWFCFFKRPTVLWPFAAVFRYTLPLRFSQPPTFRPLLSVVLWSRKTLRCLCWNHSPTLGCIRKTTVYSQGAFFVSQTVSFPVEKSLFIWKEYWKKFVREKTDSELNSFVGNQQSILNIWVVIVSLRQVVSLLKIFRLSFFFDKPIRLHCFVFSP